jgi:Uma2 family endonuclease
MVMTVATGEAHLPAIVYPESDGKPMADNTKQARWMVVFHGNLEALLREKAFVAIDLMWYARQGDPSVCAAPDVLVAFGRPAGDRTSYRQWEEGDVAPQVVMGIVSPGNTPEEMEARDAFYTEHGVEEYFVYDPEKDHLSVYLRKGSVLRRKWFQNEYTSPRLGIRFDITGPEMQVFHPDGRRFLTFAELEADRSRQVQLRIAAERLARRLAELSRKVRRGQATPEEVAELERLENEADSSPP